MAVQSFDQLLRTSHELRGKHQELARTFKHIRNRYILVKCAWCDVHLGWRPNPERSPINVSHGVCPACYPKAFARVQPQSDRD